MIVSRDILERQIEQYQAELTRLERNEKEFRSFLRVLNSSEEALPDAALDMFDELCDKHIPNG